MRISDVRVYPVKSLGTPAPKGKGVPLVTPMSVFPPHDRKAGPRGEVAHVIVEVVTDEGIRGYGTIGAALGHGIYTVRNHLKPLLVGEDPMRTEFLWERMFRATVNYGRKGMALEAISAVDIALWDIKGKALGQPVYNLLGGKVRDRIPVYASRLYASVDLDTVAEEARTYVNQGFKAMKLRLGYGPADGAEGVKHNRMLLKTIREVVGDGIELMVDVYMGWDFAYFLTMLPAIAEFHVRWLEEPVMPDDYDTYAQVKRLANQAGVMISGGEHEFTRYGFRMLLERECVDILQPDVNRMGGVTEAQKVWALAASRNIPVIPHAGQSHNYHLVISHLNSPVAEYFPRPEGPPDPNEIFWCLFDGEPEAVDGHVELNGLPGFGIEPKWDVIEAYKTDGVS